MPIVAGCWPIGSIKWMRTEILYDIVLLEGNGADLYSMRSANFWQDCFGQHDPEIILRQANPENCPFGGSLKAPIIDVSLIERASEALSSLLTAKPTTVAWRVAPQTTANAGMLEYTVFWKDTGIECCSGR